MSDLPPLPDGFQIETPQTNNGAQDQSQNQAIPALPEGFQLETANNPAAVPEQSPSWLDTAGNVISLVNDVANPGASLGAMIGKSIANSENPVRTIDSFMRGAADTASFGTADEIAGIADTIAPKANPFRTNDKGMVLPSDPISAVGETVGDWLWGNNDVQKNIDAERAIQAERDRVDPGASTTGRLAGALLQGGALLKAGAPFMASLPEDASLLAKSAEAAKAGALYSGLYGAGSGEGLVDRLKQGSIGAVTGGVIGAATPVIAEALKAVAKPFREAATGYTNPTQYADQKIADKLADAGMTTEQAVSKMERTPGLNVADVSGRPAQNLLRSTTNVPGKAQQTVNTRLALRAMLQGDRLKTAVKESLADPDAFIKAGDKLSEQWSKVGNEVYEPALAKNVVWTDRLKQFVNEPIFQRSLNQGVKIQRLESLAENKPFNPVDYAITGFNEAGEPIISGVPNMRTLNVAKKGLDAIISDMKNPLTGKLTEEGRATDMVRRAFLREIDSWNPEYQQARSVWGGFAKVKEAMLFGQNDALQMSPEAVAKTMNDMSVAEKQAARVGVADAMRKEIDAAGYTHNAVFRLIGNRQKFGVLRSVFPDAESFSDFRKVMFAEARKRATYEAVKANSTTARQLADMADTGGFKDAANIAVDAVKSGPMRAAFNFVGSRLKMLGGLSPESASDIANKLMSTNPETLRDLAGRLQQIEIQQIPADQKKQIVYRLLAPVAGDIIAPGISQRLQNN